VTHGASTNPIGCLPKRITRRTYISVYTNAKRILRDVLSNVSPRIYPRTDLSTPTVDNPKSTGFSPVEVEIIIIIFERVFGHYIYGAAARG